MTRIMIILGATVLVAALLLVHLVRVSSTTPTGPDLAHQPPGHVAILQRTLPVDRPITVTVGQPIAPGLPPWTKPLATLRPPPVPEGTAIPPVPQLP